MDVDLVRLLLVGGQFGAAGQPRAHTGTESDLSAPNAAPILLILIAGAAAGLLLFPYVLVLLIIAGYLCTIPFTIRSQRWVAARPEAWDDKPASAAPRGARAVAPRIRIAGRWPGSVFVSRAADSGRVESFPHRAPEHHCSRLASRRDPAAPGGHRRAGDQGVGRGVADRIPDHRRRRGVASPDVPAGTALLDDVTLSNAGLRENSAVLVSAVTVYGARTVTLRGSAQPPVGVLHDAAASIAGQVMTVGDTVSLLPRDLGPGTSTSAASAALTSSVGITWTSGTVDRHRNGSGRPGERAAEFGGELGRRSGGDRGGGDRHAARGGQCSHPVARTATGVRQRPQGQHVQAAG